MVHNREEAARRAENSHTNTPGMCQKWTRDIYGAPSAGDVDGDGDNDAVDGWRSEPRSARHFDRNPPRGVPVAFAGGSSGFGHRAVSLGGGKIRSTDMAEGSGGYQRGVVGTVTIDRIEASMGVTYSGWSETITGIRIPIPVVRPPVTPSMPPSAPYVHEMRQHINEARAVGWKAVANSSGARRVALNAGQRFLAAALRVIPRR